VLHFNGRRNDDLTRSRRGCAQDKHLATLRHDGPTVLAEGLVKNCRCETSVLNKRLLNVAYVLIVIGEDSSPIGSSRVKTKHDCTP
jgi:hypothetical protein